MCNVTPNAMQLGENGVFMCVQLIHEMWSFALVPLFLSLPSVELSAMRVFSYFWEMRAINMTYIWTACFSMYALVIDVITIKLCM